MHRTLNAIVLIYGLSVNQIVECSRKLELNVDLNYR